MFRLSPIALALALALAGCPSSDTDVADTDAVDTDTVDTNVVDTDEIDTDVIDTDASPTTATITQYGVTWTFASPVPYGTFANGDPWVQAPVTITAITPDFDGTHHGWEVDPSDPVLQGFDTRIYDFDASRVPALPYTTATTQSLVKSVSLEPLADPCRPCLQTAVVLTVLEVAPSDGGLRTYRPPYAGTDKTLRSVDDLQPELLPTLAVPVGTESLDDTTDAFTRVQLDHKVNWVGRHLHPADNSPDYGSDIASRNAGGALRLMLDEPLIDKEPLLIAYTQYGLDLYGMMRAGTTWPANGGHDEGRKLPIAFTALLLGDPEMATAVADAPAGTFGEDSGMYVSPHDGVVLYGQAPGEDGYWRNVVFDEGSRTLVDPYGWIDGGWRPGDSYQFCCLSMVWKSTTTALRLVPELQETWDFDPFVTYSDRWVAHGTWTQPDPCAPPDGVCAGGDAPGASCTTANERAVCTGTGAVCDLTGQWDTHYRVTYGPDGAGGCIADQDASDGIGRFPDRHGMAADSGYYQNAFANALWDAHLR